MENLSTQATQSSDAEEAALRAEGSALKIPNFMPILYGFKTVQYSVSGSGAEKLVDSGVAPLIASARGYSVVNAADLKADLTKLGSGGLTSQAGKDFKHATTHGEAMFTPWFSTTAVSAALADGLAPRRSEASQLRPNQPLAGKDGKTLKYRGMTGRGSVLDLHQATPRSWIEKAPKIHFAEGLWKADATLTALLFAHGASETDLATIHRGNASEARKALSELMEDIPEKIVF